MNDCVGSGEVSVSSSGDQAAHCKEGGKKKRNLPGMPGKFLKFLINTTIMLQFQTS